MLAGDIVRYSYAEHKCLYMYVLNENASYIIHS